MIEQVPTEPQEPLPPAPELTKEQQLDLFLTALANEIISHDRALQTLSTTILNLAHRITQLEKRPH